MRGLDFIKNADGLCQAEASSSSASRVMFGTRRELYCHLELPCLCAFEQSSNGSASGSFSTGSLRDLADFGTHIELENGLAALPEQQLFRIEVQLVG